MTQIYTNANSVWVWLGPLELDLQLVIDECKYGQGNALRSCIYFGTCVRRTREEYLFAWLIRGTLCQQWKTSPT